MYNSTIKRKKCKCSDECDKYPTIGYGGYYIYHFPGEIKKQYKNKRAVVSKLSKKLHEVQKELKESTKVKTKSELLKVADILFGAFIKRRDSDKHGYINCICCGGTFNLKDKNPDGDSLVQAMHFVSRGTYALRFDETNVHSGCSKCNLDMHLHPEGFAYQRYRSFLIDALGLDEVQRMEELKREIGKITESDLKLIIDKYKSTKNDPRK
jgi:hypothetical protein